MLLYLYYFLLPYPSLRKQAVSKTQYTRILYTKNAYGLAGWGFISFECVYGLLVQFCEVLISY